MMAPGIAHWVEQFSRQAGLLPGRGIAWLARLRGEALERFAVAGLPTTRDEDWKYTSLRALETRRFEVAPPARVALDSDVLAEWALPDAYLLVFVDGRLRPEFSRGGALPAGTMLTGLAGLLERAPDWLEPLLAEDADAGFAALNAAFMADGACLRLPAGSALAAPVQLLFVTTGAGLAVQPRNLIVAGEDSRACIVEHHVGLDGAPYLGNALTRIVVGAGASVEHVKLQEESPAAWHIAGVRVRQAADSRFASASIALGGALSRVGIDVSLDAEGAGCELDGLYLAGGRQHSDHHTRVDHRQPGASSREHYRGVMAGEARAVFNGKVVVHPDAQRSDAFQANHNLLLSDGAEVDSKPELEIYADDVKCGHGATIGQLDEDQVFYLRARGLDAAAARALLTLAFARTVIERVRAGPLRQRVEQRVARRLAALQGA